jgi:hypothetical protein
MTIADTQQRYAKLPFPTIDGTIDPLLWLNCYESFRGQHAPDSMKIGYSIFRLIDIAQLWYMHLTEIKAVMYGEHSVHCTNEYFGLPTCNTLVLRTRLAPGLGPKKYS